MATAIDLAGTEYPTEWEGVKELEPLQGKSLLPILKGETREAHEELYFHFSSNRALITADNWKLVCHKGARWELYNLSEDPTELNDLASAHPDRVKAMSDRWQVLAIQDRLNEKARKSVNPKKDPPLLEKGGKPAS
jgi:arylsulfatase